MTAESRGSFLATTNHSTQITCLQAHNIKAAMGSRPSRTQVKDIRISQETNLEASHLPPLGPTPVASGPEAWAQSGQGPHHEREQLQSDARCRELEQRLVECEGRWTEALERARAAENQVRSTGRLGGINYSALHKKPHPLHVAKFSLMKT